MHNEQEEKNKNHLDYPPQTSWDDKDLDLNPKKKSFLGLGHLRFATKFFIGSLLFFILVGAFVAFSFFNKDGSFDKNRIVITATGPGFIMSGTAGKINLTVANNNNIPISDAYVIENYNSGKDLSGQENVINQKIELGNIVANSVATKALDFTVFGAEGSTTNINLTLYYQLPDSKGVFSEASDPVIINLKSAPVTISVSSLKEIHNNYNLTFKMTVKNNTNFDIQNLLVAARNPNDFFYASSSQALFNNQPAWKISNLKANSSQDIEMTGKLSGYVGEIPEFTFYTGLSKDDLANNSDLQNFNMPTTTDVTSPKGIDTIYSEVSQTVEITGQYLDLSLASTSGVPDTGTLHPGDVVRLEVDYKNLINFPLDNTQVQIKVLDTGDIASGSIQPISGTFNASTNVIFWDKNTLASLARVGANAEGKLELSFKVSPQALSGSKIEFILSGSGERNSEENVSNQQDISQDKVWTIVPY